jgi:ABC-2 type transport system permease protein
MVLAGLWLLFVVLVPSLLNITVKTAWPVPSRLELIQAMRAAGEAATRNSSQLLARFMEDHPEMMSEAKTSGTGAQSTEAADYGTLLLAVNDATERDIQPVLKRFDDQVASQQRFVDRLQYLSPAIVAQSAFNDLAGAGFSRYSYFLAQVEQYHQEWRAFFAPRILNRQKISVADIGKLPTFHFQEERGIDVFGRVLPQLVALSLGTLVIAVLAHRLLNRYPIAG